ncbi:uncharacterized protein LOC143362885 [Halictus rubicundus]|uniref:uncharacterized protein LOC143362885 n=1 Tax=Halictus rubicundus TaxID=77578 RepID=UPI004036EACF
MATETNLQTTLRPIVEPLKQLVQNTTTESNDDALPSIKETPAIAKKCGQELNKKKGAWIGRVAESPANDHANSKVYVDTLNASLKSETLGKLTEELKTAEETLKSEIETKIHDNQLEVIGSPWLRGVGESQQMSPKCIDRYWCIQRTATSNGFCGGNRKPSSVRTLHQLAEAKGSKYPVGAQALRHDSYIDDILTGSDSIPALKEAAHQLQQLCKAGGFPLQKWASNAPELHDGMPQPGRDTTALSSQPSDIQGQLKTWTDTTHSTPGLQWSPQSDCFRFTIAEAQVQRYTKRGIVSRAAQLFDPLGWLTPVVNDWRNFCSELTHLAEVRVPRPLFRHSQQRRREYHGFADASEQAYRAVISLRSQDADGQCSVTLVTAKSKVAPLQPRLKLCAAHLLARLAQRTSTTLELENAALHLWSDSTVALGWIQAPPSRWKTWDLWWNGPKFLRQDANFSPSGHTKLKELPEARGHVSHQSSKERKPSKTTMSTLHGGVQATLGTVRQRFWIPKERSTVKAIIHRCVTCVRWRADPASQLMGQLPEHRVTPARPFLSTGVDYTEPIWLRTTSGRGHKAHKGFLAVFVCMVTKAVHLEAVSNYTAEAFLAAFRRFVSRPGICAHLYSDCGTNFLGADRELRRPFSASSQQTASSGPR